LGLHGGSVRKGGVACLFMISAASSTAACPLLEWIIMQRRLVLGICGAALLLALVWGCALLNSAPIAHIAASVLSGESPLLVQFNASGSVDPDGRITAYAWNFGDGTTASGKTASHTFTATANRTYTVTLTVTDDNGATASGSQSIEVLVTTPSDNNPPTARFTVSPSYGNSPLTVQFNASSSSDSDGSIELYGWDFGDGKTGSGMIMSHTFTAVATSNITVTLTVTDDDGATGTTTAVITVIVPEVVATDGPTASFTVTDPVLLIYHSDNPSSSPSLFEVEFDPSASTAAAGGHYIEFYLWNFGDGETLSMTTDAKVKHPYELRAQTHTFVVTLTVIDEQGLTHSAVGNVTLTN